MKNFELKLTKRILAHKASYSNHDVSLELNFTLPFVPFIGLILYNAQYDDFEEKIKELAWDVKDEKFYCFTEQDTEIYDALFKNEEHRNINDIIAEYEQVGWMKSK